MTRTPVYSYKIECNFVITEINLKMENKQQQEKNFTLTGIFIHDNIDGRYTGFFSELPEAVSQGETLEEAETNLFNILPSVMEVMNKANQEQAAINGDSVKMITKSYKFQTA